MNVVDSYSQSIAKLETQLGQLAIAVGKREERKLPSHSVQNPKGQQFEQLKAVMVLRSGKEVDNKVGEKEHDKQERCEATDSNPEIEKENNLSPSPAVSDPIVPYKQGFLTLKLWMHLFLPRMISKEMTS